MTELKRYIQAGVAHSFILHLNVGDYVAVVEEEAQDGTKTKHQLSLRQVFRQELLRDRKMVIFYDRSQGVTFGGVTTEDRDRMEQFFRKLNGIGGKDPLPISPLHALAAIERVLTASEEDQKAGGGEVLGDASVAVVIGFAETLIPAGNVGAMPDADRTNIVTVSRWARSQTIASRKNLIFMLTVNAAEIAPHVRGSAADVVSVKIPFPDLAARVQFLKDLAARFGDRFKIAEGTTIEAIAKIASGLSLRALEDMVQLAIHDVRPLDIPLVFEEKRKLIEALSGGLLRVVRPNASFDDIGGLTEVKRELVRVADAMKKGDILGVPEGVLLMGPPGTAKSVLSEAVAEYVGIPMVDLRTIRDMWVGSSEQRQELALTIIDELQPVIVRRDEADAEDRKRGADQQDSTGVNQRLQKREFEFFSDPQRRGKVLLFRITNRPDLMDPAALRAGRSDLRIPVLPSPKDLPDIMDRLMRMLSRQLQKEQGRELRWNVTGAQINGAHSAQVKEYTGADVRAFLAEAGNVATRRGADMVTMDDIKEAAEDYLPTKDATEYAFMISLALSFCTFKRLIPLEWQEKLERRAVEAAREAFQKSRGGGPPSVN